MSMENLFDTVNQAAKTATETVNIGRDLDVYTPYKILECKRIQTIHGVAVLIDFHDISRPNQPTLKMWLPRRISKIFVDNDEQFEKFATTVRQFYFLGMDGRSAKFKFEFV